MRKFLFLALVMSVAPVAQAELKWSGGAGVRHLLLNRDDGLGAVNNLSENKDFSKSKQKRWEFRGMVGVLATGESVDAGFDVRSNSSQTSEWVTVQNGGDFTLNISQAFARVKFKPFETDLATTVGRAKTVLAYDNMAQMLFDNDTRWDGFGWSWKMGMFGFNAAQYVLGATNNGAAAASTYTTTEASQETGDTKGHFGILYAFQPNVTLKLTDDISMLFAVSYLNWSGTGAANNAGWYTNAIHGGVANSISLGAIGNVNPVVMDNAKQWHFLADTSLPFSLRFVAEYIMNKKVFYGTRTAGQTTREADKDALALSLAYGKPKKAGEFGLAYSYSNKGIASVIGTFSNGDIAPDNMSHMFEGRYMLADSFSMSAKAQWHTEKAKLGGDGLALTGTTGANSVQQSNRKTSQQRYEIIGTISI